LRISTDASRIITAVLYTKGNRQVWEIALIKATNVNPPGTASAQGLCSHTGLAKQGIPAYIPGQLSAGLGGRIVGKGDFSAQFRQVVFRKRGDVLEGLGAGFDSILKFTAYLVHSQGLEVFMSLRRELFSKLFAGPDHRPNAHLMIDRLVKEEFPIEVEAIAVIEG
jgi:enamine deaminase RidA (YjgF/YER057c/UK114 family)